MEIYALQPDGKFLLWSMTNRRIVEKDISKNDLIDKITDPVVNLENKEVYRKHIEAVSMGDAPDNWKYVVREVKASKLVEDKVWMAKWTEVPR